MKNLRFFLGLSALLVLAGAGCQKATNTGRAPETSVNVTSETQELKQVKVGVMLPFSGDASSYGESVKKAVELAKSELGVDTIELVYEDSKCEGKDAATAVQKLISVDKVSAIIGELCSGASLAAAPVAEQNKVIMISPASTAPNYSDAGEYIYRTVPSDLSQGAFGAKLASEKGLKKMAVLYTNDDYGVGFDQVLKAEFPKLGGEVVASEAADRQSVDLRTQLTKIKAANPDSLYIISNSPDTASAALKQAKELGLQVALFGSEGLKNQDIVEAAQGAADGLMVTAVSGGNEAFAQAHKNKYAADPGPFAAQGYDAFKLIAWAVQAGAGTGEEIKAKLDLVDYDGATGRLRFDAKGDVSGSYEVYVVKNSAFVKE